MVAAGALHFVIPGTYARVVPGGLGDAHLIVYVSGAAEVVAGALLAASRTRRIGAWCTAAVLVAIFPANVKMALDGGVGTGALASPLVAWLRLPLQVPLVAWALRHARPADAGRCGLRPGAGRPAAPPAQDGHPPSVRRVLPVILVGLVTAWAAATTPYQAAGPAIRSDGSGYDAWTQAIVTADLSFCGDRELEAVRAISARDPGRGVCQNKYPPGTALLRLPVTAWLVDREHPGSAATEVEHLASRWLSALILVTTTSLVVDTCRRLRVGALPTGMAVLGGTFGTGLFHYATYDGSFSHGTSALLVAWLCWLGARASIRGAPPPWPVTTSVCALATLTRITNVVIMATLLVGWLAWQRVPLRRIGTLLRHGGPVAAGVLAGMAVQVAYNRYATGAWALSSYGAETFAFDRPRQSAVLVSYERGLLTWYPVLGVGFVVMLASGPGRRLALWAVSLVLPLVVLYGFWYGWHLGGGFGHRGFVEVVPALVVLMAIALDRLPLRHLALAGSAMAIATLITVSLMAGYWRSSINFIGTTGDVWWDHVAGAESFYAP